MFVGMVEMVQREKVADEGQGSQKGAKEEKSRVAVQFMGGEKVKDVEIGDIHCDPCNMDFPTTKSLRSHNKKCHQGKVLYQCSECGKGLMSKEGMGKTQVCSMEIGRACFLVKNLVVQ